MSKSIYDRFDSAFSAVSAWAVLHKGKAIGRVVMKHGASVTAFVHLTGSAMASGRASGGGYDKATAAVREAIAKLDPDSADLVRADLIRATQAAEADEGAGGSNWCTIVARAGFELAAVI